MATVQDDGSIILSTKVDTSGLNKGMSQMEGKAAGLTKAFSKLGAAIGSAFAVQKLVQFGKEAINIASDLQEVQNVVDVAFGDMSYKIEEFSKTAIESFGISELTAKRTASTYMAMAKGMGIAGDAGSDMAITLTGLTADMASFYNVSQDVADTAIKSIFTGETESLKKFGIIMSEVNLQEFARQKGIEKSISAMTQQEKTMLRYNYVLQQTALAQGDFVRTQDGWANKTRVLNERWKELQASFGELFMAIGTLVLPVIEKIIEGLNYIADALKSIAVSIGLVSSEENKSADIVGNQAEKSQDVAYNIEDQVENQEELNEELKKSLAGFDDLNILTGGLAENTEDAEKNLNELDDIQLPSASVTPNAKEEFEVPSFLQGFVSFIEKSVKNIAPILEGLGEALKPLLDKIASMTPQQWEDLFEALAWGLGTFVAIKIASGFVNGLVGIANGIKAIASSPFTVLVLAASAVAGLVAAVQDKALEKNGLKTLISDFQTLKTNIDNALSASENFRTESKNKLSGILDDYAVIDTIADKYYDLSQKANLSDDDKHLLEYYYDFLTEHGVDLTGKIDEVTKAYKGTREELEKSLETVLRTLAVEAAKEDIVEAYRHIFELEKLKGELEKTQADALEKYKEAVSKYENSFRSEIDEAGLGFVGAVFGIGQEYVTAMQTAQGIYFDAKEEKEKVLQEIESLYNTVNFYTGIVATGGQKYVDEIAGGLEGLNDIKIDPDMTPLEESVDGVTSGLAGLNDITIDPDMTPLETSLGNAISLGERLHTILGGLSPLPPAVTGSLLPPSAGTTNGGYNLGGSNSPLGVGETSTYGGGNTEVVLEIDGREFGRAVVAQGTAENRRVGTKLVIA